MVVGNHEFLGNLLEKVLDLVEQLNDFGSKRAGLRKLHPGGEIFSV